MKMECRRFGEGNIQWRAGWNEDDISSTKAQISRVNIAGHQPLPNIPSAAGFWCNSKTEAIAYSQLSCIDEWNDRSGIWKSNQTAIKGKDIVGV